MPNIVAPKGFVPIRHNNGAPYNGQHTMAYIPSSDGTAVFIGDVVVKAAGGGGAADTVVNGVNVAGMPIVAKATGTVATGQNIFGVVVGFVPSPTMVQTGARYRVASTAAVALVVTDPAMIYECQEADANHFVAGDIGEKCSITAGTGNTTTGLSTSVLDTGSETTTATLPVTILGLSQRVGSEFGSSGAPATYEVMLNMGVFTSNTAGIE